MTPLDKRHLDTLRHLDAGGSVPADELALAIAYLIDVLGEPEAVAHARRGATHTDEASATKVHCVADMRL